MGIGEATCKDFDLTVRAWKRFWDYRAEQTIMVVDTDAGRKHRKPMKPERKYKKLYQILGLNRDFSEPERVAEAHAKEQDADRMAQDMLSGNIDWSDYGLN